MANKFKVPNTIEVLKGADGFRQWRKDVSMLLRASGLSYLMIDPLAPNTSLTIHNIHTSTSFTSSTAPHTSTPLSSVFIKQEQKGKKGEKGGESKEDDDEESPPSGSGSGGVSGGGNNNRDEKVVDHEKMEK